MAKKPTGIARGYEPVRPPRKGPNIARAGYSLTSPPKESPVDAKTLTELLLMGVRISPMYGPDPSDSWHKLHDAIASALQSRDATITRLREMLAAGRDGGGDASMCALLWLATNPERLGDEKGRGLHYSHVQTLVQTRAAVIRENERLREVVEECMAVLRHDDSCELISTPCFDGDKRDLACSCAVGGLLARIAAEIGGGT